MVDRRLDQDDEALSFGGTDLALTGDPLTGKLYRITALNAARSFAALSNADETLVATGVAATDTADIQTACDDLAADGKRATVKVTGTAALNGRINVPTQVNLVGTGVNWGSGAGTRFLCTTATAGITFDTVSGGVGGLSGNFAVDGNNVATSAPVEITQSTERSFRNITVLDTLADGFLIREAQNCEFTSLDVLNCEGTGIKITDGAGGNLFTRCELAACGNFHVLITHNAGVGPYANYGPANNEFVHCIFEHGAPSGAFAGCVGIEGGFWNAFHHCALQGGANATTEPYVKMDVSHGTAGVTQVTFDSCWWTGVDASVTDTAIRQETGTTIFLTGHNQFQNLLNGWEFNTGAVGYIHGHLEYQGVTNRWIGTGSAASRPREKVFRPRDVVVETTDTSALRIFQQGEAQPRIELGIDGLTKLSNGTNAADTQTRRVGTADFRVDNKLSVVGTSGTGHIEMLNELAADPANAPANSARLFLKDNGAGKTQLWARFATGAAVLIVAEP